MPKSKKSDTPLVFEPIKPLSLRERQILLLVGKSDTVSKQLYNNLVNPSILEKLTQQGLICDTGPCNSCDSRREKALKKKSDTKKSKKSCKPSDSKSSTSHTKSKKNASNASKKKHKKTSSLSLSDLIVTNNVDSVKNIMLDSLKHSNYRNRKLVKKSLDHATETDQLKAVFKSWEKAIRKGCVDQVNADAWISQVSNQLFPEKE